MWIGGNVIPATAYQESPVWIPSGSPPPPFSPTDIAGCQFWLPGDFYTPATGVGLDQSGNGNNVGQSTAGSRPTAGASLNGHATMAFDGVDDFLDLTTGISLTAVTLVAVVNANATGNYKPTFGHASGGFPLLRIDASSGHVDLERGGQIGICTGATDVTGSFKLLIGTYNSPNGAITINGVSDATGSAAVGAFDPITNLGALNSFSWFFDGVAAEYLLYDNVPSAPDMANLIAYEMAKYAL